MKKTIVVLMSLMLTVSVVAQEKAVKKGFIGASVGVCVPMGDYGSSSTDASGFAEPGVKISLINFGYLLSDNFGITASWFGAANPIDIAGYDLDPWSFGGLMVGPLFTHHISETVDFDLKGMLGLSSTTEPIFDTIGISLAMSLGGGFKFNVSDLIAFTLGADFFSTKPEFEDAGFEQSISTLSLNAGMVFRF